LYDDLWDIGVSPIKPVSRICAFITNPLGVKTQPKEITQTEAVIISNFKKLSRDLYNDIKTAFDKMDFQCVSIKFETYNNGADSNNDFAIGFELKVDQNFLHMKNMISININLTIKTIIIKYKFITN
jgi:hypothetical protein